MLHTENQLLCSPQKSQIADTDQLKRSKELDITYTPQRLSVFERDLKSVFVSNQNLTVNLDSYEAEKKSK